MIGRQEYEDVLNKTLSYFEKAKIVLTENEKTNVEIADFGLGEIYVSGLQLCTYINTDRVCAKEMVVLPHQTCPEHRHPDINGQPGKEETFRCRYGKVYLYVDGDATQNRQCSVPEGSEAYYSAFKEVELTPGDQYTICPNTRHWFQAGEEGTVISEFSTHSDDTTDIFTDIRIKRIPEIK